MSSPLVTRRIFAGGTAVLAVAPFAYTRILQGAGFDAAKDKATSFVTLQQFGAKCDGRADDTLAIRAAHDNAPEGATVLVQGAARFTQPLIFDRRLNWLCVGSGDYFRPDNLRPTANAITVAGDISRAGQKSWFNIFNAAFDTCRSVLVLQQPFMSEIGAWIAAGGAAYNMEVHGALESEITLWSSVNYTTPLGSPYLSPNHLKVGYANVGQDAKQGTSTGANGNRFHVKLAGRTHGIIIEDMGGGSQGTSRYSGLIQGMTGSPFKAVGCFEMALADLYIEGCRGAVDLQNCTNARINGRTFASGPLFLAGCANTTIEHWAGGLEISASCRKTLIGDVFLNNDEMVSDASPDTEWIGQARSAFSPTATSEGANSAAVNLHPNPFVDIWPSGPSAAPLGFEGENCTFTRSSSSTSRDNPVASKVIVRSRALAPAEGCRITIPKDVPVALVDRWVSFSLIVRRVSGAPTLAIRGHNGTTALGGKDVTGTAETKLRFSIYVPAGVAPHISMIGWNGSSYAPIVFDVLGLTWSEGPNPCDKLRSDGARERYILSSVSAAPAFAGQMATSQGVGYMATGTASRADWKRKTG